MKFLALVSEAFGGWGGIAQYNQDLLSALCAYGERTEVVAVPRLVRGRYHDLPKGLIYRTWGAGGKIRYIVQALRSAQRGEQWGAVICGHINLLPLASWCSRWLNSPLVLVIYGIDAWKPPNSRFVRKLIRTPSLVISISRTTMDRFVAWSSFPGEKVSILPNAIRLDAHRPVKKRDELLARYGLVGKTVLMTAGRLAKEERYKGVDEVLNVLPDLIKHRPDLFYLIVGDGSDCERLKTKANELGLQDRVVFAGYVEEEEKIDHFRLADVFVMPGRGEGFGQVFLEAMACGVPVVASALDGSREAVMDGRLGVVVNPDDRNELIRGILRALSAPRGVVPQGLEHFSYENFVGRLHDILDRLPSHRAVAS